MGFFKEKVFKKHEESEKRFETKYLYVCKIYLLSPSKKVDSNNPYISYYNLKYISTRILYGEDVTKNMVDPISGVTYLREAENVYRENFCFRLVQPLSLLLNSLEDRETITAEQIKMINNELADLVNKKKDN